MNRDEIKISEEATIYKIRRLFATAGKTKEGWSTEEILAFLDNVAESKAQEG